MSRLIVNPHQRHSKIKKEIYGHFSEHLGRCIYEGLFVGENSKIPNTNGMRNDVVEALRELRLPVLRWPGGCFADEYHWKDGIGPLEGRKKMINTHWGGVVEDNSFGTHEFMELCRQIGCEAYINGNVGSGTVQEMSEWVEYLTFDGVSPMAQLRKEYGCASPWNIKYFGVGNESWGCGGNMTPEYYANEYRRYQTYVRNYGENKIYRIACGANGDDYNWTDTVMKIAHPFMDGLSLHYYTIEKDWTDKGSATEFDHIGWYHTLKKALFMEELITRHSEIMDRYDPEQRIGLLVDEWGCWFNVEPGTNPGFLYQQNTMRDALVAGVSLNIFNKHCDRVHMANIAQLVNVLQSVILTEGEKMLLTPTYHVFNMYKHHQEGTLVYSFAETEKTGIPGASIDNLHESASIDSSGILHITLNNLSVNDSYPVQGIVTDTKIKGITGEILSGSINAHNTFEAPDQIHTTEFTEFTITDNRIDFTIPASSIIHLSVTI